jgi:hypothetical protein
LSTPEPKAPKVSSEAPARGERELTEAATAAFVASLFEPDSEGDRYYRAGEDDPAQCADAWREHVRAAVSVALEAARAEAEEMARLAFEANEREKQLEAHVEAAERECDELREGLRQARPELIKYQHVTKPRSPGREHMNVLLARVDDLLARRALEEPDA